MSVDSTEAALRKQLKGKALLGEVAFEERHCAGAAALFRNVFAEHGLKRGLVAIQQRCPITFAMWLVNEAFYGYDAGYWPSVLQKVGVPSGPASARLGQVFLNIVEEHRLPRFRRLNTHWSYLGPILAHCGVPRSRLPQFFAEVLPTAAQIGMGSAQDLADLQERLPEMRLSRSIEWFIRYGDSVASDFVRRCLDLYRIAQAGDPIPSGNALGLPERVVREFDEWRKTSRIQRDSTPRGPRPRLYFEPGQGIRLELPGQPCSLAEQGLDWEICVDVQAPVTRHARRFPGESRTEADDLLIAAPFESLVARLKERGGRERGTWILQGLSVDRAAIAFGADNLGLLPLERVEAAPVGLPIPTAHSVRLVVGDVVREAAVLARMGRLAAGWVTFDAAVYDCTDGSAVEFVDEVGRPTCRVELAEQAAPSPRLNGTRLPELRAHDGTLIYVGSAPTLQIPTTRQDFEANWAISITPNVEQCTGRVPGRIVREGTAMSVNASALAAGWLEVRLDQEQLLGREPWGSFDLVVSGPLGLGGRFKVAILPHLRVEYDWSQWTQAEPIQVSLTTTATVTSGTAKPVSDQPGTFFVGSESTPFRLRSFGYGQAQWTIPFELHLALPSWSVYDQTRALNLAAWTGAAASLALPDTDGGSPLLLLRLATPHGIPAQTQARLCHGGTTLLNVPIALDERGYGSVDLVPFLANARQARQARLDLMLDLQVGRVLSLQCLRIERQWTTDSLSATDLGGGATTRINWTERNPIEGRVLKAYPLLTPWEPPRSVRLAATTPGRWEGPAALLAPDLGRFRLEIGVEDEWAGTYECAASCVWDHGTFEQWRQRDLYSSRSIDGVLFRYLLTGETLEDDLELTSLESSSEELTAKVLMARATVVSRDDNTWKTMIRLLDRVPMWSFLRGILAVQPRIQPEALLELVLLSQSRDVGGANTLDEVQADELWRLWPPLGAWADMRAFVSQDNLSAQARLNRRIGYDALQVLDQAPGPHPDGQIIELVRRGDARVLKLVQDHVKPYPTSPVGAEAFQEACFAWAIRAAEQADWRAELVAICRSVDSIRVCTEGEMPAEHQEVYRKLLTELGSRTYPHPSVVDEQPLLAVHRTTWLIAAALVWRSLGRPPFLFVRNGTIDRAASGLQAVAPALLAHDLIKVCAIEVLHDQERRHAAGSEQTDE